MVYFSSLEVTTGMFFSRVTRFKAQRRKKRKIKPHRRRGQRRDSYLKSSKREFARFEVFNGADLNGGFSGQCRMIQRYETVSVIPAGPLVR